jgi:hypothetical protein
MSFERNHPDYAAIEQHIRHAGMERSVAFGESLADVLLKLTGAIRKLTRRAREERVRGAAPMQTGALGIVTGQFERLGNAHREVLGSIRANAHRDVLTATGSFVRRTDIQR